MRKFILALIFAGAGFGASYMLFEVASASAAEPRGAIRFSTGNKAPMVITTSTASAPAKLTNTGAVVVPTGAPTAMALGHSQVGYTTEITYAPNGREPQVLAPGVIASSDQIQRFRDRRFRFSFFNNSVIPNTVLVRPVTTVP